MSELPELLREWEQEWVSLGVPVQDILLPGLDPAHVADTLTRTLGVAPDDLVHWFSWHDGTRPELNWDAAPCGWPILPLVSCLHEREVQLSVSGDVPDHPGMEL